VFRLDRGKRRRRDDPDWLGAPDRDFEPGGVHDPKDTDGNISARGGERFFNELTTRLLRIVRADYLEDVALVKDCEVRRA